MRMVLLTALGVGGATVFGTVLGFAFKKVSHKFSDIVLAFAAGVMLAAAVLGLILPSLEYGGKWSLLISVAGIFAGAVCVNFFDRLVPHLHRLSGADQEAHPEATAQLNKVLLFVTAIAIHNLPEGIAAGVSFGTGNAAEALTVAGGIALQNIPEGMVLVAPMLAAGVPKGRTFDCRSHRRGGSAGYFAGLLRGERFRDDPALCPGVCRRHHALCDQR